MVIEAGADVVLADVGVIGTVGFFLPACAVVLVAVVAVVRDRRRHAADDDRLR